MPILGTIASSILKVTNSYDSISTVTIGAGGASSISFSSIPSTYTHLQIRYIARGTDATDNNMALRINSDSSAVYSNHLLFTDGSSLSAQTVHTQTQISYLSISNSSRAANAFSAGVIDILDYKDTNKNKTVRALSGREDNANGILIFMSGLWVNTSAVTTLLFYPSTGNFAQYSTFALYGMKSA